MKTAREDAREQRVIARAQRGKSPKKVKTKKPPKNSKASAPEKSNVVGLPRPKVEDLLPPAVTASAKSAKDADDKRAQLEADREKVVESVKPVTLKMDEFEAMQLENFEHRTVRELRRVTAPLKAKFQIELTQQIQKIKVKIQQDMQKAVANACIKDVAHREANTAQILAVNKVIEKYTEQLPEGHYVSVVDSEHRLIVSEYNPEARGRRLKVPVSD